MASVEIVTIGTELLLGTVIDGNGAHIGAALAAIGLDLYAKHSVGDNELRLAVTLEAALGRSDGVITTGGLGPTVDDLTKEAIARSLGLKLQLHEPSLAALTERLARSGRSVEENNKRQAILPEGALVLPNPHGTAPGFIAFRSDGRFVAAMPGVPREMRAMLATELIPWLRERFSLRGGIVTRTLHTAGMPESEVDRKIEDLFRTQENPKIAVLAKGGYVDVKIMAKVSDIGLADAILNPLETIVRERIGEAIFGSDDATLAGVVVEGLRRVGRTLAFAESCTGGLLSDAIVSVPGASAVLLGGVTAYANEAKTKLLAVPTEVIAAHGAVSGRCAEAMAAGAQAVFGADIAVSTTGIAGPGGGSAEKPVGTVYLGIALPGGETRSLRYLFHGDRSEIRTKTVLSALINLREISDTMHGGIDAR